MSAPESRGERVSEVAVDPRGETSVTVSAPRGAADAHEASPEAEPPAREAQRPTAGALARAALQPRMLVLLLVVLVAAGACGALGRWQLERAQERGAQAERHRVEELASAGPVDLGAVLAPQVGLGGDLVGKSVRVTGRFEDGQLLVEGRAHAGRTGYLVLAPLRVTQDGTDGASWAELSGPPVLPVVRGWVAAPADAPAPPSGTVTVTGYLQTSESVGAGMVADGVTDSISSGHLANVWGGPVYSGYVVLSALDPADERGADAVALLERPRLEGADEGLNLQNLFYAVQWWIFGLFALGLWVQMVRDEARVARDEDAFTGWDALQPRAGDGRH